ncbi:MAG: tyrosine-type recombinase/integrase [Oscillospiraceae bacterium]|nr:tyrosine-type recombinase/integrase [Oscillospiraceae bacterium]
MDKIKMNHKMDKTFEEGFEEYVLDMKARNLRQGTISHYKEAIKQIYKRIPPTTMISTFSKRTMKEFYVALRESGNLNDISMGTYARDLKTIMRFFMREGYLEYFEIKIPKADQSPIQTYTDEELRKLLKKPNLKECTFAHYRTWVMVCLLLSSGLRRNSLVNLRCKDVDYENEILYVNTTKNRKILLIPLNEDIVKILEEYQCYRKGKGEDFLLCNTYGGKLSVEAANCAVEEFCKSRGITTYGIHRFRHTFAKKWVIMGGSLITLQKILGHSSLNITEKYINLLTTDIKRDIDEFNILRELNPISITMK